jgi:hypothetical protein
VELLQQVRIELKGVELDRVGHTEQIGEAQEEKEVALPKIVAVHGGAVGSHKHPLVHFGQVARGVVEAHAHTPRTRLLPGTPAETRRPSWTARPRDTPIPRTDTFEGAPPPAYDVKRRHRNDL